MRRARATMSAPQADTHNGHRWSDDDDDDDDEIDIDDDDDDDDASIGKTVQQKSVPSAVFGGLQ